MTRTVSIRVAAKKLDTTISLVVALIRTGHLKVIDEGGRQMITRDSLLAYERLIYKGSAREQCRD